MNLFLPMCIIDFRRIDVSSRVFVELWVVVIHIVPRLITSFKVSFIVFFVVDDIVSIWIRRGMGSSSSQPSPCFVARCCWVGLLLLLLLYYKTIKSNTAKKCQNTYSDKENYFGNSFLFSRWWKIHTSADNICFKEILAVYTSTMH